jgi:transcription termination/antitermination protein NusG
MNHFWFAVRVRSRHEALIKATLENKGYEAFLPTYRPVRGRRRSSATEVRALFPGYLFCRFDPKRRLPILVTPGVIQIVGVAKTPVPVDEAELEYVRRVVEANASASPVQYMEVGQKVRLESGPLAGIEGILQEIKNTTRLVVCVTVLRRSLAVEIDADWVGLSDPAPIAFGHPALGSCGLVYPPQNNVDWKAPQGL